MADWKQGFMQRFGEKPEDCTQADVEDAAVDLMDKLAAAVAELPPSVAGVRVKPPCEPCARMASMAIH